MSGEKWQDIAKGPFDPTWKSLRAYEAPEWFRDAKLGIWSHWGPQSVPMFGDWYARNMYIEGSAQYLHHWRVYGHPSRHGWKDVVKLWKAERFSPDELMDLYVAAGAHYFVAQAVHHDNFDNWDSAFNRWNSVSVGPGKDIVGLWRAAAKKRSLPFGVTEHLGASFSWWSHNKNHDSQGPHADEPYDGADSAYEDLYHANAAEPILADQSPNWYTADPRWHEHWFERIKDLIDKYEPDLLYSDGPLPFERYGLGIVAHLYNTSAGRNDQSNQAVYTQKDRSPLVHEIGVLDIERNVLTGASARPWQTDTCVGGWFYDVRQIYKTPRQVVEMLVDIVAKNGNLLLNLPQRPDGTLDEECLNILSEMARWTRTAGEGIFGTRPWEVAMEGETNAPTERFKEDQLDWTPGDFRYTSKPNSVYAFIMSWPATQRLVMRSFSAGRGAPLRAVEVRKVELLGHRGELRFIHGAMGLEVEGLPSEAPLPYANCLRVTVDS